MVTPKRTVSWPYFALLAEVLLFFRDVLFRPGEYAIPWDLREYHLPLAEFVAKCFRHGYLPLWDPFTYCGWPLYAELTAQVFYPPTLVTILISNLTGGHHLLFFLELELIAHVLLGGVSAYWLLRRLGAESLAAFIGATVYQLGPFFASQTQHLGAIGAGGWLPLSWLAIVALSKRFTWRWVGTLALSLAMSILCGFPAVTAVAFVSCFLLACALISWRSALGLAASAVWAVALAGIQALPTAQLNQLSVAKYRGDWLGAGGGHPLQALVSILIPNYWGIFQFDPANYKLPWNLTYLYLYFGLIGLAFVVAAVIRPKNPYVLSFAALTAACLLWMLGEHTPVGLTIFRHLPTVVKLPLYAEYALPAFALGTATLAGLGAQSILSGRRFTIQTVAAAACAIELIAVSSSRPMNTSSLDREPGVTYDQLRALVNKTYPPSRIDTMNGSLGWASAASLIEVPTAGGNDPMAPERVIQVRLLSSPGERWGRYYEVAALDSPYVDLLNVRYVISRSPIPPDQLAKARFRQAVILPGNFVYENMEALPRFFLVTQIRKAAGLAEAVAAMRSADFNPRSEAVVEGDVVISPAPATGTIRTMRYHPLEVQLEIDTPTPAYLVTSETNYPGWEAFVDGHPQPIFTTNAAFRGLPVPAGRHAVTMRFRPPILWQGAALSLSSWLGLAALLFGHGTYLCRLSLRWSSMSV